MYVRISTDNIILEFTWKKTLGEFFFSYESTDIKMIIIRRVKFCKKKYYIHKNFPYPAVQLQSAENT